jgi:DNA mismatch endonuclease (patch repair protein)
LRKTTTLPPFTPPPSRRSRNMAAITSKGNKSTERRLRAFLVKAGIGGWSLHGSAEIGSPDFTFSRPKIAVFVHGCFWHSCPRCGHVPKTNSPYWTAKLERNRSRDRRVQRAARDRGYVVVRIWECDLRERPTACVRRIKLALKDGGDKLATGRSARSPGATRPPHHRR